MTENKPLLLPGAKPRTTFREHNTPPPSPPMIFHNKPTTCRSFEIIENEQLIPQRQDANSGAVFDFNSDICNLVFSDTSIVSNSNYNVKLLLPLLSQLDETTIPDKYKDLTYEIIQELILVMKDIHKFIDENKESYINLPEMLELIDIKKLHDYINYRCDIPSL